MESLAEFLGTAPPRPSEPERDFVSAEHLDAAAFCRAVVDSREFRQYILNGIVLGDIPPAILGKILDQAWGKPPDRIEHTGKDGQPIETITEVRRIIVRADAVEESEGPWVSRVAH